MPLLEHLGDIPAIDDGNAIVIGIDVALPNAPSVSVLIPLILEELKQGHTAGLEHYRHAGLMLIEARDQVAYGQWGRWLSKNFELTHRTANQYMRLARGSNDFGSDASKGDGAVSGSETAVQTDLEEAIAAAPAPADELPDLPAGLRRA